MAFSDHDEDATELIETYGASSGYGPYNQQLSSCASPRLPYEIHRYWSVCSLGFNPILNRTIGEAGSGKSCLLHHFTHNSCWSTLLSSPRHLIPSLLA